MKKSTKPQKDAAVNIWCGPTIPGVAKHFEIYGGGVPANLTEAISEHPAMGGLLVAVSDFPKARVEIETGSGRIATLARMAEGYYTKGGK